MKMHIARCQNIAMTSMATILAVSLLLNLPLMKKALVSDECIFPIARQQSDSDIVALLLDSMEHTLKQNTVVQEGGHRGTAFFTTEIPALA